MAHAFDAETPAAGPHDPREALQSLARTLLPLVDATSSGDAVDDAVDAALRRHGAPNGTTWPHLLDDLVHALGARVAWRLASPEDITDEVEPAQPAVTWTPAGWIVLGMPGSAPVAWRCPGPVNARALSRMGLPETVTTWALLEPALAASMLGGADGLPPWRRVLGLLRAERHDLYLVLAYALAAGILGLATPVAVQVLVNTVAFGAFRQPLLWLSGMLLVCLGLAAGLRVLQRYVVELLQRRVFVRMVADLAARLPRVRVQAWDRTHGPELVNRFFDVLTVQKSMSSLLLDGLSAALQALVGMVLLALYHPALLGFDLLLLLSILALVLGLGRGAEQTAVIESKKKYLVAGWLEEVAAHPNLFKLGGGPALAARRADSLARGWLDARADHFRVFFRQYGGALLLQAVANTALLAIGGWLVLERQLTIGQLVAAEFIVATVLLGFAKFSEKLETVYDLLAAVDKLGQLVDLPLERTSGLRTDDPTSPTTVRVEGVTVSGSGATPLFDDLTFAARPGERLAIMGVDGSGKSTLADILLGLREPTRGQIILDDTDLRELRLDTLRRHVALLRDAPLVSGTLADNVAMGRPDIGAEDVHAALERVGLSARIKGMPKGVDTPLTAAGSPLTTGERARLAAARAIVGSPRLLVVDGLLDILGPDDRDALIHGLAAPDAGWTLIVLTRDLGVAQRMGRALRLDNGKTRPMPLPTTPGPRTA